MSQIAGLQDFRQEGPPADVGTYVLTSSALVFPFTFSGTTYYAAIRPGISGWVLLDQNTVPEDVINQAFTTLGAGARVVLLDGPYTLQVAGISFTANEQVLDGQGRSTFIDGDALATGVHAINLSGFDDCIIRNLSVQTEDGGGKNCDCISIENGANRFTIENVIIVNSDDDGINIVGTTITGGYILNCKILAADDNSIYIDMDAANYLDDLIISKCQIISSGDEGIYIVHRCRDSIIADCILKNTVDDGINVYDDTSVRLNIHNNKIYNAGDYGLFSNAPHSTITENHIYTSANDGLSIRAEHNIIAGNNIYGAGDFGIFNNEDYCIIIDNHIERSVDHGINCSGDRCVVSGNIVMDSSWAIDNTDDGIYIFSNRSIVAYNHVTSPTGPNRHRYCINIVGGTLNRVFRNILEDGQTKLFNDAGTDTILPELPFVFVSDPDGNIGTHPAVVLTDGVDITVRFQIHIPMEFQELVRAQVIIVPGGTGNLRRNASTNFFKICAGEVYNVHTDALAAGEVAVTINVGECLDISGALDGIALGDLIGVEFTREGSHANDTVNANCYFLGFRGQYV